MEGLEWDERDGRPGVPPVLTPLQTAALFNKPVRFLASHPGLQDRQARLLTSIMAQVMGLETALGEYHHPLPCSRMGQAHLWGDATALTEGLLNLTRALLATLLEQETED